MILSVGKSSRRVSRKLDDLVRESSIVAFQSYKSLNPKIPIQNFPQSMLPSELKDGNPLNIFSVGGWRLEKINVPLPNATSNAIEFPSDGGRWGLTDRLLVHAFQV